MKDREDVRRGTQNLRGRIDELEEAVHATLADSREPSLTGRVRRLEEAVGDIYQEQAAMDTAIRKLVLSRMKIRRALDGVVVDIAELASLYAESEGGDEERHELDEEVEPEEAGAAAAKETDPEKAV